MSALTDAKMEEIKQLAAEIGAVLYGRSPEIQGSVLADLVATHVAGHAPQLREKIIALHVDLVRQLVPITAKVIAHKLKLPGWAP